MPTFRAAAQLRRSVTTTCRHAARQPLRLQCRLAVGIDLGTTNSAVSIVTNQGAQPVVLRLEDGASTCPSVVQFTRDGVRIGQQAQEAASTHPSTTYWSTKRLMGKRWEDVEQFTRMLPYKVLSGPGGAVLLDCPPLEQHLTPEQVGAEVIRYLLQRVQEETGEVAQQAVVTVPAYFDTEQRAATVRAGTLAGLAQVSLLQEPVAAALAHGFGMDPEAADTILVADLGGGTFDVSLLDGFEGILEVLATDGDDTLGGNDFDRALTEHLLAQLPEATSSAIRADAVCVGQVMAAAEASRIQLSTEEEASVQLPLPGSEAGPSISVTRQDLEKVLEPLLQRLWEPLERLAAATHTEYADRPWFARNGAGGDASSSGAAAAARDKWAPPPRRVTGLVIVGGAAQTPAVRRLLEEITGLKPREGVDPRTGVALGAGVQAGVMTGLLEVGPELMDGSYLVSLHDRASGFQHQ